MNVIVVGSGIAGLFTALRVAQRHDVTLVTKAALEESNTRYAQGGIAAVMFDDDDVELHVADTLAAGAGLCNIEAVRILCSEGPARVGELLTLGVEFDRNGSVFARGREAAHSRHRVLHAGGDATGSRIESTLAVAVRRHQRITVLEHRFLTDLAMAGSDVMGVHLLNGETLHADAVVLASGGAGQVYQHTTNPAVATGDGVAAAFRAGAAIADAEFFQFHPTALALPGTFLVSEAVRGEGALLRNQSGERFVDELAPRDVVARAIAEQMTAQDGLPVLLDATAFDAEFLAMRFPSIDSAVRAYGIAWEHELVPVTPAAHYWMGGIATDLDGRTNLAGLYACGEVANTGVHGANRLASNSLLEGLVFGARIADSLSSPSPHLRASSVAVQHSLPRPASMSASASRDEIRRLMWDNVGLIRERHDLAVVVKELEQWIDIPVASRDEWETRNLATVGWLIASAALDRRESIGAHFRSDYPPC